MSWDAENWQEHLKDQSKGHLQDGRTNTAIIYKFFNLGEDNRVWLHPSATVIQAIATLRAFESSVPVYVIDSSPMVQFYSDWPDALRFKVVRQPLQIPFDRPSDYCEMTWQLTSEFFDRQTFERSIPETICIHSDTDLYWNSSPFPLLSDPSSVCGDIRGTGYYYYNKNSILVQEFFATAKSLLLGGLIDSDIRNRICLSVPDVCRFTQEPPFRYLARQSFSGFHQLDLVEHNVPPDIVPGARNYHVATCKHGYNKALWAFNSQEYREAMIVSLGLEKVDQWQDELSRG